MKINFFKNTILASVAMLTVLSQNGPAFADGTLRVSSPQDPGSWDPIDTYLVNWASVATNIFDGLTYRGPDAKLVPGLATSWQVSEEGKKIRFTLRQNVKFHNNEPFNAAAVKFTFDRLLGEEGAKGPQRSNYSVIEQVNIVDDYTIDMLLKSPDPVLLTKLAGYGSMIVPPKYIQENGDAVFNKAPIGTGPFKVVSYTPKINVKLEAFQDHWGGSPKLSNLEYQFIAEPATAVSELQTGGVDLVIPPTIPISMIDIINEDDEIDIVTADSPTVYALRFNTKSGITADVNVRKALIMAVDRKTIIEAILGGQASEIASFQGKLSFGYDAQMAPLPYDPVQAKKLLAAAGVMPGSKVQIDFRGNNATFNEVVQAVSGYLQSVGIMASLKPYETNVLLNDIVPNGKTGEMFQQSWGGWTLDFDNTAYAMYHTGQKWNPYDSDMEMDRLLESQRVLSDQGQREKILKDIANYAAERALEMPLYNLKAIYGINKKVKNFVAPPDSRMRLTHVSVDK